MLWFRVLGVGCKIHVLRVRVYMLGLRVYGLGFTLRV